MTKGDQTIIGTTLNMPSESTIKASFTIPVGYEGSWSVIVTNPDGSTGTLTNGFTIR
ncbi:MAG: hypothetical protein NTV84_00620 [Methanoregula sp.]|nr:hypothetical protein [Methanoregula sp.]